MALTKRVTKGSKLTITEGDGNLDYFNIAETGTGSLTFENGGKGKVYGTWDTPITGDVTIDNTGQVDGGYVQGVWNGTTFAILGVAGALVEFVTAVPTVSGNYKFAVAWISGRYEVYFPSVSGGAADTTAPVLTSATVEDAAPSNLVLTYNEALDATSTPLVGDFAITVDAVANVVTAVVVSSTTVTLTLTTAIVAAEVVVANYTAGLVANRITDTAGNDAANLVTQAVVNNVAAAAGFAKLLAADVTVNAAFTITPGTPNEFASNAANAYGYVNVEYTGAFNVKAFSSAVSGKDFGIGIDTAQTLSDSTGWYAEAHRDETDTVSVKNGGAINGTTPTGVVRDATHYLRVERVSAAADILCYYYNGTSETLFHTFTGNVSATWVKFTVEGITRALYDLEIQ